MAKIIIVLVEYYFEEVLRKHSVELMSTILWKVPPELPNDFSSDPNGDRTQK